MTEPTAAATPAGAGSGPARKAGPDSLGFHAFLWTQALGAFNDNAFKTFVALWAMASLPAGESSRLIAAAGALFIVPFLVFSTVAGDVADRWSKKSLTVLFKTAELALLVLGFFALYLRSLPALFALLFLMGVHSAFFSPVKLAILPELLDDKDLSNGNGLVQSTTFLGIILGTVAAAYLQRHYQDAPHLGSVLFIMAAGTGLLASFLVPDLPPAGMRGAIRLNFLARGWANLLDLRGRYGLYLATVGSAYFWFVGAIFQMNILVYGKDLMGLSEAAAANFQVVVALGIGLGSYAAGRMSREQVELGLVPVGALGLVLFSCDLAFSFHSSRRTLLDLGLLGMSGGCFAVPLQAFIQLRSPASERGRIIATGNILSFLAMLLASAWLWAFSDFFKLHPGQIFLVVAVMTLVVASYIVAKLPDFFLRFLLYPFANLAYRLRVEGRERVPVEGPALLVSNHISFIDPVLVAMANPRLVRFLMFRAYYELPVAHWFFKAMGCIPISDRDSPRAVLASFKAAREALQAGELVCIFAEGEISRHGQMLKFKKGFERIVKGLEVPVIPVSLDRVWGSIFSFEGGRVLFKRPRRLRFPITVAFGDPLPAAASAFEVRQAILELGSETFRHRLAEKPPLPVAFLREAKRHWLRFAMADSSGTRLNYGDTLVRAYALGGTLDKLLPDGGAVGVLLPPSVGGALANIGLSMTGRVPINLNYTTSKEIVFQCADKAQCRRIVTSRRFLEKLGWEAAGGSPSASADPGTSKAPGASDRFIFIEDAAAKITKASGAALAAAFFLLPSGMIEWFFLRDRRRPRHEADDLGRTATVIFTSGSTGIPKGVLLSHANIWSNIEGLAQIYPVGPEDRILGILPFFHSFGYTATLWFPLLNGFGAVYHHNPLESKRIGELAQEFGVTFLLATPTFLTAYIRRVEPEKFRGLRYVVAGAEKLREDVARAFEEKYGLAPLEGYGCTELSPAAAANIPDVDLDGVRQPGRKSGSIGRPLPGVMMKVVDPETAAPLPAGAPGLLLVKGPNVMQGYLGEPEKTAQVLKDGYYVTGDVAVIDEDGFVTITDRLSRFSKIGGEMVPHVKVEGKLHELLSLLEQTFIVTSVPDERRGERLVVLYKGELDIDELAKKLQASDLPKLWIPDKSAFHKVEEFPLLGSGKLDIQKLKAEARVLEGAG